MIHQHQPLEGNLRKMLQADTFVEKDSRSPLPLAAELWLRRANENTEERTRGV